jgi:hypothetical protein
MGDACLKCGKCPLFSPQFYQKHKCMHCYCGVVHHRGVTPASPRAAAAAHHADAEGGTAAAAVPPSVDAAAVSRSLGGVPVVPFVWTRHMKRSQSQVRGCAAIPSTCSRDRVGGLLSSAALCASGASPTKIRSLLSCVTGVNVRSNLQVVEILISVSQLDISQARRSCFGDQVRPLLTDCMRSLSLRHAFDSLCRMP